MAVPSPSWVIWTAVGMASLMSSLSLFRHWHYLSHAFDLGFYVQDVWAINEGIWRNTIGGFHVFDDHFSPIMILLAPLSRLSAPEALLIVQALAVASGVIPAFTLGTRYGGHSLGRLAVVWYALSVAVWHAVAFDFHPVTLGVPLLVWLIDSVDQGRRPLVTILFAIALALMREDLAVLAGIVLVQAAILRRSWRDAFWAVIPASIGAGYIAWASVASGMGGYNLWERFSGGGGASMLDSLAAVGANLIRPDPLISFSAVLLPFLVIPVFKGWSRSWPGLAMMLVNGAASYVQQSSLYFQYFAPVVPFLLWGAVAAWPHSGRRPAERQATVASIALFAVLGPLVYIGFGLPDRFISKIAVSGDRRDIGNVLSTIPKESAVSATDLLVPHLSERREVYPFPGPLLCSESLIFHVDRTNFPPYIAIEWADTIPGVDWQRFLAENGYEEAASNGDVAVWKLNGPPGVVVDCPSWEDLRRRLDASAADGSNSWGI